MHSYLFTLDDKRLDTAKELFGSEDIKIAKSLAEINENDRKNSSMIFDKSYLSRVVYDQELLSDIPDKNLYFLTESKLFFLALEDEIISDIKRFSLNGNLKEVKLCNESLIFFDFVKHRAVQCGMPSYIQMETTSFCNARCVMCSHFYTHNKDARHLDFDMISNIEPTLRFCNVVGLQGMGEPLLHPEISNVIERYAMYGVKISATTNLSLLDGKRLDLIDRHFSNIQISLDGGTKETFEYIRRGLKFEDVCSNIELLSRRCPDLYKEITVVLMRQNITELEKIVDFARSVNVNQVIFHNMTPNSVLRNERDAMSNYPLVLNYFCQLAYKRGREIGIEVICPVPFAEGAGEWNEAVEKEFLLMNSITAESPDGKEKIMYEEEKELYKKLGQNTDKKLEIKPSKVRCLGICDWLLNQAYIALDGSASVCCSRRIYKTGQINQNTDFKEIWNGEISRKMREIFYSGYLPECCLGCVLAETGQLQFLKIKPGN